MEKGGAKSKSILLEKKLAGGKHQKEI